MSNKTTILSDFLLQTDALIRVFDMGRRVSKIPLSEFQKFERAEIPYPFPYGRNAWIGLIYWNKKDKNQHNIWFLRMPLDEMGSIQLSARDEFMHLLLSRFNETIQQSDNARTLEHVLKDNPYVFKPAEDKMAVFHAKALQVLQQNPTQFFNEVVKYLKGNDYQHWQHLGLQGIADVAVRHDKTEIHQSLLTALPKVPTQVFSVLCQSLESENIHLTLAKVIMERINSTNEAQSIASGIGALASCQSPKLLKQTILSVLNRLNPYPGIILIAIAAKTWEALLDKEILTLYLAKLSDPSIEPELFNSLMLDLMFMPDLREKILLEFRDPNRSENLSKAVGHFFQGVQ